MGRDISYLVVLGAPGAGKGVQSSLLSDRRGLRHISTGAVLRDEMAKGSRVGRRVKRSIDHGHFADDETMYELVRAALEGPGRGGVLDGYPRNVPQARHLDKLLEERGEKLDGVIYLAVGEDTLIERLMGRIVCSACGRTYHRVFHPPRSAGACDACGGSLARREDDSPDACRRRLRIFSERTRPLLAHYRARGLLDEVGGDGPVEAVARGIETAIECRRRPSPRP